MKWNVTCSDMFYFDQKSLICVPQCGVWTPSSRSTAVALRATAVAVGTVAAVCILVISCLNRQK